MKKSLMGSIIIICSVLLIFASALICILGIPRIVDSVFPDSEHFRLPGMVFMWITAAPVMLVLIILITVGKTINEKDYISYIYIQRFRIISMLVLCDTALYLIPIIFFLIPDHFDLGVIAVCITIQICGFSLSAVSYTASAVMEKASEYKDEVDTMI